MKYKIIILMIVSLGFAGCGNTPIFTEMKTNRLKVVIKGTYESEVGSNFVPMIGQDPKLSPIEDTNSVDDVPLSLGTNDVLPTTFMLDIAELRLNGKKFANYRQVFEASLTNAADPFFNGSGVVLVNDDPGQGQYNSVEVFIRKMAFDSAMIYQSAGSTLSYEKAATVIFHENDRAGYDFNQLQVNSYWDSLRLEQLDILRCFPIYVPIIGGLEYNRDYAETVLEIRFVIKNFVKKYEYDYYDEGVFKVVHYYALSDWLRDVRVGEDAIGRNLHAVARAYVTGTTGEVTVTGVPLNNYVIAIPESEPITDYFKTASGVRGFSCDLPQPPSYPGPYIEAILDYYLKYEKYKNDYNAKLQSKTSVATDCWGYDSAAGTPNYTASWDAYEDAVENFKIAPYVAFYNGIDPVVFKNMAPGRYKFYRAPRPLYGELFLGAGSFTAHNLEVAETIIPGPQTFGF